MCCDSVGKSLICGSALSMNGASSKRPAAHGFDQVNTEDESSSNFVASDIAAEVSVSAFTSSSANCILDAVLSSASHGVDPDTAGLSLGVAPGVSAGVPHEGVQE